MSTIADVKKYWNNRPCNIRHSTKPMGSRGYFDDVEKRKYFVEPHIPAFAEFDKWKGKKVLEIGCGIGTDSVNFARAGAELTIIDVSSKSLEVCKKRFKVFGLEANFYCGSAEDLSKIVPVEQYDLVYSFGVIHHTPDPDKVYKEILKYCKPETELRIMVYSKWCWKVLWVILKYGKGAFWRSDELVRKYSEAETGCPVTFYYSASDIKKVLSDYDVFEVSKDHIFPYVIEKYIKYEYQYVWYFRWMPKFLFRAVEKAFGWHTLVKARPKA